jgi:hypothetical protein
MLLSCSFLTQVADVNNFNESPKVLMTEGDTVDIWLQLKDMSQNPLTSGFNPPGRRYMPPVGATLQVIVDSLNTARKVVKFATQPFANDPSIWKVTLLPADKVVGTHALKLVLTEGGKVTNGVVSAAVHSTPLSI